VQSFLPRNKWLKKEKRRTCCAEKAKSKEGQGRSPSGKYRSIAKESKEGRKDPIEGLWRGDKKKSPNWSSDSLETALSEEERKPRGGAYKRQVRWLREAEKQTSILTLKKWTADWSREKKGGRRGGEGRRSTTVSVTKFSI